MELLAVSVETLTTVARLRNHYIYLLTVYYRNSKIEGMVSFLKNVFKGLQ